jgi:staphylococcal nuclease domain-containing protein 1
VAQIVNGAHFYAQVAGDTAPAALQEQLKKSVKANGIGPFEPKAGHYCCAKFTQDDEWYRAKVSDGGWDPSDTSRTPSWTPSRPTETTCPV